MTTDMRAAFDAWAKEAGYVVRQSLSFSYSDVTTRYAWRGWQAHAESVADAIAGTQRDLDAARVEKQMLWDANAKLKSSLCTVYAQLDAARVALKERDALLREVQDKMNLATFYMKDAPMIACMQERVARISAALKEPSA